MAVELMFHLHFTYLPGNDPSVLGIQKDERFYTLCLRNVWVAWGYPKAEWRSSREVYSWSTHMSKIQYLRFVILHWLGSSFIIVMTLLSQILIHNCSSNHILFLVLR